MNKSNLDLDSNDHLGNIRQLGAQTADKNHTPMCTCMRQDKQVQGVMGTAKCV